MSSISSRVVDRVLEWVTIILGVVPVLVGTATTTYYSVGLYILAVFCCITEIAIPSSAISSSIKRKEGLVVGGIALPSVFLSKVLLYEKRRQSYNHVYSHADQLMCILPTLPMLPTMSDTSTDVHLQYFILSVASSVCTLCLLIIHKKRRFEVMSLRSALLIGVVASITSELSGTLSFGTVFGQLCVTALLMYMCLVPYSGSFSMGESMVVSQGITLYAVDAVYHTTSPKEHLAISKHDDVYVTVQCAILGATCFGVAMTPLLNLLRRRAARDQNERITYSMLFYVAFLCYAGFVMIPWLYIRLNHNPILWIIHFVISESGHIYMLCYWLTLLCFGLGFSLLLENRSGTVSRKYFHMLALLLFLPGIVLYFMSLCFGVAVAGFIFIEMLRYGRVWPLGDHLGSFLSSFIDEKDSGPLITTHIYLLLGCAIPLWLCDTCLLFLSPLAGLIIIGIGDSAASIVGYHFGTTRWPGSKKTLEGTAAAIASVFCCCMCLSWMLHTEVSSTQWMLVLVHTTVVAVLEATTDQVDNLFLPIYFFALLLRAAH